MNGKKVGVAQLEAVSLAMLMPRKDELLQAMAELRGQGYQSVFLMLTDIMQGGSDFLFLPEDAAIVESALNLKAQGTSGLGSRLGEPQEAGHPRSGKGLPVAEGFAPALGLTVSGLQTQPIQPSSAPAPIIHCWCSLVRHTSSVAIAASSPQRPVARRDVLGGD